MKICHNVGDVKTYNIWTDGGSRGNPGPAAIGIYILDNEEKCIYKLGKQIGVTTNNVAEYSAVISALNWIKNNIFEIINFSFHLDSLLVVSQLNSIYKIKDEKLKLLFSEVKELEKTIDGKITYQYLPREKNKIADKLLNDSF